MRQRYDISLGDMISKVADSLNVNEKELLSSKRQARISDARAIICYLGVMELGVKGIHVGRALKISGQSVSRCLPRLPCAIRSPLLWGSCGRWYWGIVRGRNLIL
jgi:hypothetical protein